MTDPSQIAGEAAPRTVIEMEWLPVIKFPYDQVANAGYLRFADSSAHGGLARTVVTDVALEGAAINLDFANDGILLGMEFLGVSRLLPEELRTAGGCCGTDRRKTGEMPTGRMCVTLDSEVFLLPWMLVRVPVAGWDQPASRVRWAM